LPNCDVVGQETSRSSLAEIVDLKSSNKSIEFTPSTSRLERQQNKGNGVGCAVTGLTGARTGLTSAQTGLTGGQPSLTTSFRASQNKSKHKKVKPKKPEIGVWKTTESKDCHKHQREKPKSNEKLPAKSQRQNNVNGASRSKNYKCPKPSPREKFHNKNRQWCNSHKSMLFPSYG
jgi:hypothetical protein